MWAKHPNKELSYNNLPLSKRLFQALFFSFHIQWFNLDDTIGNSESLSILKKRLLSFICPIQINVHNIFDPKGLKFLTRLGLSFSHLNEHRFLYNFQDCLNSLHSHSLEIEDWSYELCKICWRLKIDLMNCVKSVSDNFESLCGNIKKDLLLHCDSYLHRNKKKYFGDNSNIYYKFWKILQLSLWINILINNR